MRWLGWAKSLKTRFALLACITTAFIIFVITVVGLTYNGSQQKELILNGAKGTAAVAAPRIVETFEKNKDEVGFQLTKSMRSIADNLTDFKQFQIVSKKGDMLFDSLSIKRAGSLTQLSEAEIVKAIQSSQATSSKIDGDTIFYQPYFNESGTHTHTVRYTADFDSVQDYQRRVITQGIIALVVLLPLVFALFYLYALRHIAHPIDQMRTDLNLISAGDPDHRIHLKVHNEFGQLADSFNTMAHSILDSIKELEEEKAWKNEFIILASHNLRTPLNVIMSSVASIKKNGKFDEASQKFLDYIYTRGKELHGLIENLLSISTLKGGRLEVANESFDLLSVVNSIAKDQETRLKAQNLTFTIETRSNHIIAQGDKDQMFQIIDNLVDNAIKFTQNGGVTIRLDDSKDMIHLAVIDTGAGIEEKMVHKLFESFRRGANPMSVDHKGAGLGLYFVKLAIESQGGKVAIKSKPGKGTEISMTIPKGHMPAPPAQAEPAPSEDTPAPEPTKKA